MALPTFANNRARLTLTGRYIDAPDVRYFGVGDSSHKVDETRFGYTPTSGGARLDVDVSKHLSIGGGVEYNHVKTSEGKTAPSIETVFSPANTPGLEIAKYDYVKSSARAAFDWRRRPGYTGSGGLYRVQFDDFRERNNSPYSFNSVEAEARQLIPILRANWVIALRAVATITDFDEGSAVPYFLLPSLGGGTTLRGYPDFRFRDRNRLVMNAELRWTPARFMDMAIFYDTGKVTARREDLDFEDLKESYGIGMRLIGVPRVRLPNRGGAQPRTQRSSHRQRGRGILAMAHATSQIRSRVAWALFTGLALATALTGAGTGQKFFPDDPIARVVDSQDAARVEERDIDLVYDTLENSFSWPGDRTPNVRAQNVNTVDEVPDSTWFTNRLGTRSMTVDELLKGPDTTNGPAPGNWTVISAKNDGVTPGFTVRDAQGTVWFLKFDPPGHRGMATGTEVVVTKLFWALGYYLPEVHLASLRPEQLTIDEAAKITPPSGNKRRFQQADIRRLLRNAHQDPDGSYRVIASKALEGRPVGGFRFYGTRSDDPNDLVAARASPGTARLRHVLGVGEPCGFEVNQYARYHRRAEWQESDSAQSPRLRLDDWQRRGVPARSLRGIRVSRRGQAYAGWNADIGPVRQRLADHSSLSCALGRCVSNRPLDLGSREVETTVRELGIPIRTTGRQVLGGAPPPGVHRRDVKGPAARRPVR